MTTPDLIGFVRKSKSGNVLRIELSKRAFNEAQTYQSRDGQDFVSLVISLKRIEELIGGQREVTAVSQMRD